MSKQVPPPGPHGGDGPKIARALGLDPASILDLSQTLNPFAPDLGPIVSRHLSSLRCYPDPEIASRLLADAMGVSPDRLLLTNGGSEAISLVAAELGGRVRSEPEFALHPRGSSGPIWRSNPHSPTGHLATENESADVWDEAFYQMATGEWTAGREGIVVGSLTKLFACPGLRLGYIIADDVGRFARRQPGWSVGSLALAVLPDLLASCELKKWARSIEKARDELAEIFVGRGFEISVHDAPWILVAGTGIRDGLLPHGVVVRDCTTFGLPDVVRVAVPPLASLDRVRAGMDHVRGT